MKELLNKAAQLYLTGRYVGIEQSDVEPSLLCLKRQMSDHESETEAVAQHAAVMVLPVSSAVKTCSYVAHDIVDAAFTGACDLA